MPLSKHHADTYLPSIRVNHVNFGRSLMAWLHIICDTGQLQLRMEDIRKSDHPAHLHSYVTNLLHCWACHIFSKHMVVH